MRPPHQKIALKFTGKIPIEDSLTIIHSNGTYYKGGPSTLVAASITANVRQVRNWEHLKSVLVLLITLNHQCASFHITHSVSEYCVSLSVV